MHPVLSPSLRPLAFTGARPHRAILGAPGFRRPPSLVLYACIPDAPLTTINSYPPFKAFCFWLSMSGVSSYLSCQYGRSRAQISGRHGKGTLTHMLLLYFSISDANCPPEITKQSIPSLCCSFCKLLLRTHHRVPQSRPNYQHQGKKSGIPMQPFDSCPAPPSVMRITQISIWRLASHLCGGVEIEISPRTLSD